MIPQYPPIVSTDQAPQAGALDALPAYPLINWRSLGWMLVIVMICAGLLGLMAVGSH